MKVVLFCGGQGLRLREHPAGVPKPMVTVGQRPIIWHIMRYYAHFGHTDFILCLGYGGQTIKEYFLDYDETVSNDFVLRNGGRDIKLLSTDIDDWNVTFVDTGLHASVGERLLAVRPHLDDEDVFLANYSDGLANLNLAAYVDTALHVGKVASFVAVHPAQTFHVVDVDAHGIVNSLRGVTEANLWVNGGFFVFRHEIFEYLNQGEDLVEEPFSRLIKRDELYAYTHDDGFWVMDTFKDYMALDTLAASGQAPWEVWTGTEIIPERRHRPRDIGTRE